MLDSSNELVDPSVASLSHPEKQINYIANAVFHTELAQKKKWERGILQFLHVE
jgi:hypothetical protein